MMLVEVIATQRLKECLPPAVRLDCFWSFSYVDGTLRVFISTTGFDYNRSVVCLEQESLICLEQDEKGQMMEIEKYDVAEK